MSAADKDRLCWVVFWQFAAGLFAGIAIRCEGWGIGAALATSAVCGILALAGWLALTEGSEK